MSFFDNFISFFKHLFGIRDNPPTPVAIVPTVLPTNNWTFQYSTGVPSQISTGFTFPSTDGVHYLVKNHSGSLSSGLELTFRIDASPDAVFDFHTNPNNTGDKPSSVSLYFQRVGDNLSYPFYRWYAINLSQELKNGTYTVHASLDPSNWVSVYGVSGATAIGDFEAAKANVGAVGMTFGGGSFAGHGVFVPTGTATMTILDWKAS